MAEFQEMVREFHRLCETQRRLHKNTCDKCPIKIATMGTLFQCYRYVLEKPKEAENIIMAWAIEHPEPVYPTWREYLLEQGVLDVEYIPATSNTTTTSKSYVSTVKTLAPFYRPIQDDIAEKLGLEPKENRV